MAEHALLDARSISLRRTIVDTLAAARRGHLGAALSLVEILRVLYDDILRYDPKNPQWTGRDRCILSKGHGCLALYVILAEKGFFPAEELQRFCNVDGILGGHPDARKIPGIEASTGSLGHGLALGLGMALHARMAHETHRVFVVLGDGECDEGSVWESAMSCAHHGVDNLTVLVDYNKMQSYDTTHAVLELEPFADKWRSFGFGVAEVDGHGVNALREALHSIPLTPGRPTAILCHTVKGKGIAFAEHDATWHHKSRIRDDEIAQLLKALEEYPCATPA